MFLGEQPCQYTAEVEHFGPFSGDEDEQSSKQLGLPLKLMQLITKENFTTCSRHESVKSYK
jgi:hypothetical protein